MRGRKGAKYLLFVLLSAFFCDFATSRLCFLDSIKFRVVRMKGRGAPVEVGIYLEEEKQDGSAGNGTGNWPCSILVRGPGYNNETETEVAILASEGHKDQFVDFLSFSSYIKGIFG